MTSLSLIALISILINPHDAKKIFLQNIYVPQNIKLARQNQTFNLATQDIGLSYSFNENIRKGLEFPRLDNLIILTFDNSKLDSFLSGVEKQINRQPVDAKFEFKDGKVRAFQLSSDGLIVEHDKLRVTVSESFFKSEDSTIEIPIKKVAPRVSTGSMDNLGIRELLGRGTSTYFHSISSRVHNVVLAASRINGILVKPGETFSFNDALGDVSQFTGFQQAYIISEGKTVLGDGGGVCQVSTTLFRALLNAGLPITDRTAHAYRVDYYEQNSSPGFDATVFGPSPDLKFKNDTQAHILVVARADPKRYSLIFELYGTSDGRIATVSKPKIADVVPAPPDVYQDDPTLPVGTIKQIDFKANGAKVTFNYMVTRGGETLIRKTFISNYRPWQAVYLRGIRPI